MGAPRPRDRGARRLAAAGIAARLDIVGTGQAALLARLAALARQYGVSDKIVFVGSVPHEAMPAHYAGATIAYAVFEPCQLRTYAAPLKLVEYMAAGLPVIATRDTEAGDLVEASECGRTIECSAGAIAEAMQDLLRDAGAREVMARRATQSAQRFDWRALMDEEWTVMTRISKRLSMPEAA